ncbi:hypothetical protein [Streptomyces sp. Ag109_G2-15]|uniref:hypothetical protein n=1 Tax=Streptomyces sp. Ag109_G2-15 TaxID=1938850 RepID=UPI000BDC798E|nr:hypothetical protein [Streptomyces sp. Ag109_G2-15]SOE06813.1 hypothetical protein SAMN06272765_7678 [Streptomyces sp. Ag109_G2-15]
MRLRNTVAAACGAIALTAVLATPAQAATGDFTYKFIGLNGQPQAATLYDPASDECITLPEVADPDASEPAFAPHNDTDAFALVFTGTDCSGDSWSLRPHGRPATDRLKLRSVVFLGS